MVTHPPLLYFYQKGTTPPKLDHWPELGRIELEESYERYLQNFCMGRHGLNGAVVAMRDGDVDALRYLAECADGFQVVALYGTPSLEGEEYAQWDHRLTYMAGDRNFIVCRFDRHEVAAALGRRAFWEGVELLRIAAGYLQGEAVMASDEAMRSEAAIQRALESLCKAGYETPKK